MHTLTGNEINCKLLKQSYLDEDVEPSQSAECARGPK